MRKTDETRIRARQLALRLRSAELREALRGDALSLQPSLQWADRGWRALSWLRQRPWASGLAAAGVVLVMRRRPRRLIQLAGMGLGWWRVARPWLRMLRRPPAEPGRPG